MKTFHLFFLVCGVTQVYSAPKVEFSITVEHKQANHLYPRYGITEPSWVTELLGPTEFPVTTTRRPNLPQRIRDTITNLNKQVSTTINGIPNRINQIFEEIAINAQQVITGPGRPRTTLSPKSNLLPSSSSTTSRSLFFDFIE